MSKVIDFYYDFYSPYAYLGHYGLMELKKSNKFQIHYHPVDLNLLKKAAGNTGPPNRDIPPKIKYLMTDLNRWAQRYDIAFGMPGSFLSERMNKGTFYAMKKGDADAYVLESYKMTWGESGDPNDDDLLRKLAKAMDWDQDEFMSFLSSEEASHTYENENQSAIAAGVFGVPTMVIDDDMWWGNDRLVFVEEYLSAHT